MSGRNDSTGSGVLFVLMVGGTLLLATKLTLPEMRTVISNELLLGLVSVLVCTTSNCAIKLRKYVPGSGIATHGESLWSYVLFCYCAVAATLTMYEPIVWGVIAVINCTNLLEALVTLLVAPSKED